MSACLLVSACTPDFVARPADPLHGRAGTLPAASSQAGASSSGVRAAGLLQAGIRAQRRGQAMAAAGGYLQVLETLGPGSGEGPGAPGRETRRFATARLVELCAPTLLANGNRPLTIGGPDGRRYRVRLRAGAGPGGLEPRELVRLQPTDRFAVSGAPSFSVQPGIGAPLVGELRPVKPVHVGDEPAKAVSGLNWPVTAVAVFDPRSAGTQALSVALELYEPQTLPAAGPDARARGARNGLAADYTTPLAVTRMRQEGRRRWLMGFLHGGEYFASTGLYPTEPLSREKIPLVLVHGLISDPDDFRYLCNALAADPAVRQHYQIWVFYYPTSLPVPYSAMLLREDFAKLIHQLDPAGVHPALHRAVLVGHSLGGLLCRLAISDGGETFYRHYYREPVAALHTSPKVRELVRRVFFYRASPDVHAVVFIATPHRGSPLAFTPLAFVARLLVRLPATLGNEIKNLNAHNRADLADPSLAAHGSIPSLRPHNALPQALAEMPMHTERTRLYTVVGNLGRPGPLDKSSDGVVPYWSSHLRRAREEVIVPAGHSGTLQQPGTFAEVERVLHENRAE